jgi:ferrous iron transport protein A
LDKSLINLKLGEKAIIKKIKCENTVKRKLLVMGVTKGTEILIKKIAPLGDPIEVNIRGYDLSLRKKEAEGIIVEN